MQWKILIAVVGSLALFGSGLSVGWIAKRNAQAHQDKREATLLARASLATAEAISKIEIRHQTIRTQAETIIREVPVYNDPVCVHPDDMLRLLNDALSTGQLSGGAGVSEADPFERPFIQGNNSKVAGSGPTIPQMPTGSVGKGPGR